MDAQRPLRVSEFLAQVNELFETQVAWVEGELADVRVSQGKWLHFDLKDDQALVHCFALAFRIRTPLEDGMQARVWGVPRVYPKSGRFSLVVERLELAGEGALRRALELLRRKLADEGLFATERKRALPRFPERIALLTSPDAAAYQDFLKVLGARWGGMRIDFVPVAVQGRDAAEQIARAIDELNERRPLAEVLVLVRGGGSLEDLQAFHDELVVRALARSRIPTLVGVGHERDITLADLVADVRASTPSNAAELLVPHRDDVAGSCRQLADRLRSAVVEEVREREGDVAHVVRVLRERVYDAGVRVTVLTQRMGTVHARLRGLVQESAGAVARRVARLRSVVAESAARRRDRLEALLRLLRGLHPARVLERGYSVTQDARGSVLRDASAVVCGDSLVTRLARGTIESRTTDVHAKGTTKLLPRV